jgi:F-type H+-transporting ATPase subunit a
MVTNLFSIFDPSGLAYSINWLSLFIPLGLLFTSYHLIPSSISYPYSIVSLSLKSELDLSLSPMGYSSFYILLLTVFSSIVLFNLLGLFPYIFTPTSHLILPLRISITLWVGVVAFGWVTSPGFSLAHLVPRGTPVILIPFIVLIESIRILIRPITLAIRLMANIVAGHLLLRLAGSGLNSLSRFLPLLISQTALTILEIAVACIQGYVFIVLVALYSKESYVISTSLTLFSSG